jgi:class 3 adenylate cyclase
MREIPIAPLASGDLDQGVVTIMFTDVEGSTDLTTRRGDEEAKRVIDHQRQIIRELVSRYGGHEADSIGDGFMITFFSTRRAVSCAVAIQAAFTDHNRDHPDEHLRVRIGLNVGEVLERGGHAFGAAVNAAARVAALARGGEVLVSAAVRQLAGTMPGISFRDRGRFPLKGFPERWRLYEVAVDDGAVVGKSAGVSFRRPRLLIGVVVVTLLAGALAVVLVTSDEGEESNGARGRAGGDPVKPIADSDAVLPGRSIGDIALGMKETEVLDRYGEPEIIRDYSVAGRTGAIASYGGTRLRIAYYDDEVVAVSTTSDYYSMTNGTKVGVVVPSPLSDDPAIERVGGAILWRQFTYEDSGVCSLWTTRGFGAVTELVFPFSPGTRGGAEGGPGRIVGIRIVDEDFVDLPREFNRCF